MGENDLKLFADLTFGGQKIAPEEQRLSKDFQKTRGTRLGLNLFRLAGRGSSSSARLSTQPSIQKECCRASSPGNPQPRLRCGRPFILDHTMTMRSGCR